MLDTMRVMKHVNLILMIDNFIDMGKENLIKEHIHDFISRHEAMVSDKVKNNNQDINVRFTNFGNYAARNALYDVIKILDDNTKLKVIEMMKNKYI